MLVNDPSASYAVKITVYVPASAAVTIAQDLPVSYLMLYVYSIGVGSYFAV